MNLILSRFQTFFHICSRRVFKFLCGNWRNCSWWAIFSFATIITTLFFIFLPRCCQSCLLQICCMQKRFTAYPFPSYDNSAADDFDHILSTNLYNWMYNLWLKVENIVAKGEIAHFFFYHYVFKKQSASETSKSVCMRERVISTRSFRTLSNQHSTQHSYKVTCYLQKQTNDAVLNDFWESSKNMNDPNRIPN